MKTIPIDEIPSEGRGKGPPTRYPYSKWDKEIPENEAVEVKIEKGEKARIQANTIHAHFRRKGIALRVVVRGERVFIVHRQKE